MIRRVRNIVRGLVQTYGSAGVKRILWNREFSSGAGIVSTPRLATVSMPSLKGIRNPGAFSIWGADRAARGTLSDDAYSNYMGVDISDAAIRKSIARTRENGSGGRRLSSGRRLPLRAHSALRRDLFQGLALLCAPRKRQVDARPILAVSNSAQRLHRPHGRW